MKSLRVAALAIACVIGTAAQARDVRPRAWCGYWMRHHGVKHDPGKAFNLAAKWKEWGLPSLWPVVGAIGVQPHHVFKVVAIVDRKHVLAISGNDGGRVRTRVRSTKNVIAWRVAGNM